MFVPQQLQRHAGTAKLAVYGRPAWLRSPIPRTDLWRRIEAPLPRLITQFFRSRPAQAGSPRTPNGIARRRRPNREAGRDLAFRHSFGMKPQDVAYLPHG